VVSGKARAKSIASGSLRMILPGFEAQAERAELGEALAEFWVAQLMRRNHTRGELLIASLLSHETPWRMPRKRPPPTLIRPPAPRARARRGVSRHGR